MLAVLVGLCACQGDSSQPRLVSSRWRASSRSDFVAQRCVLMTDGLQMLLSTCPHHLVL